MKLSIIIPAYNASQTIERCVKSCLDQNFNDYEIIIVNDGSKDDTWEILTKLYNSNPKKIKILNQINQGVSVARNLGIESSSGVYIMFVDADDTIEHNCLSKIFDCILTTSENKTEGETSNRGNLYFDLVLFGINSVAISGKSNTTKYELKIIDDIKPFLDDLFRNTLAFTAVWGRLYRKEIIDKYDIKFEVGVKRHQDLVFNVEYYQHLKTIITVPVIVYNYLINLGGATSRFFGDDQIKFNERKRTALLKYSQKDKDLVNFSNRTLAFDYLYTLYSLYRIKGIPNRYNWLKTYWHAAQTHDDNWSYQLDNGIFKIIAKTGRHSLFALHTLLSLIFTAEKIFKKK